MYSACWTVQSCVTLLTSGKNINSVSFYILTSVACSIVEIFSWEMQPQTRFTIFDVACSKQPHVACRFWICDDVMITNSGAWMFVFCFFFIVCAFSWGHQRANLTIITSGNIHWNEASKYMQQISYVLMKCWRKPQSPGRREEDCLHSSRWNFRNLISPHFYLQVNIQPEEDISWTRYKALIW